MDGPRVMSKKGWLRDNMLAFLHSYRVKEVRKRKTNIIYSCICVESRKMVQMNLFARQK